MFRLWTHTSIAGWPQLAFARSAEVGGTTLQIFAKSPRGRAFPKYTLEQLEEWRAERIRTGQVGWLIHSNYLINLSKPTEQLTKEIDSVIHDFQLAHDLWYDAVNVHIGKMKWFTLDEAMSNMQKNLHHLFERLHVQWLDKVQYVRENTAGQWSEIGSTLEEIGYFYRTYMKDLPVKFCFDTAHCRWWGIDLRDWNLVLEHIDEQIGLDQLYCIHFNDAKVPLWAKLDRHASLGRWFIWWKTLAPIAQRAEKNKRALYIETPDPDIWADEIGKVRQIIAGDMSRVEEFDRTNWWSQSLKKYANVGVHEQTGLF
jgi:deoxyribonuclease IV